MPQFTIKTTYHLPLFRHSIYSAGTPEAACRLAIADNDWSGQREDYESSGESHVTGIWQGAGAAYRGQANSVPPHFWEAVQRKATQFELMLGLAQDHRRRCSAPPIAAAGVARQGRMGDRARRSDRRRRPRSS